MGILEKYHFRGRIRHRHLPTDTGRREILPTATAKRLAALADPGSPLDNSDLNALLAQAGGGPKAKVKRPLRLTADGRVLLWGLLVVILLRYGDIYEGALLTAWEFLEKGSFIGGGG